ncbi:hypothetical protein K450DRAFT_260508 [Umbelopsis ramanniana AG]|uniref:Uncharacterized protein n=1 Tax=Umbelopsis ramanniana AG TaxID=1314678 RepID=A0AAD5E1X7_UMBRA|nr:uncharacterized protein K450DRAFT_260508 [Umbelopsis ramanniana AG]KAI8575723.1 hypothetical protein K450DRAFT_260508 [Umbelopsis ramanniana AG]
MVKTMTNNTPTPYGIIPRRRRSSTTTLTITKHLSEPTAEDNEQDIYSTSPNSDDMSLSPSMFSKFSISPPSSFTSFLSTFSTESPPTSAAAKLTLPLVSPPQSTHALISHLDAVAPVVAPQSTSIALLSRLLQDHYSNAKSSQEETANDFTTALRDAASLLRAPLKLFSTGTYIKEPATTPIADAACEDDGDSAYWSQPSEKESSVVKSVLPPRYNRDIRANPDHLRMIVAEMNMMRSRKIVCPLRPRTYLHKRVDHFQLDQTSRLRFELLADGQ